ncbi:MAG: hypothetical protein ACD_82C00015G0002 [uncultured bacterium]|jgi:hypothetical protein|nr:MAG: hypothetical protein ACD_82C00015G0002 [uncultured bacterium]KKP29386.1 MAG: hypothetical protein UR12_C0008G0013 [candidate division TM6 bacterium GW2011_GWF2_30_66]
MKLKKIKFIIFFIFVFCYSLSRSEPKNDIMSFLTSFNAYSLENNNIKYSPTELSIKKVVDAVSKISDNDFVMLDSKKYSKREVYDFVAIALKEKAKNFDKLSSMLVDYKLVEKESSKKEDAENLLRMAKNFKDKKANINGASISISAYEAIPTEFDIIKAISANNKYLKNADKADVKKVVENFIKDKQQILKDLDAAFKKLPVPAQVAIAISGAPVPVKK